MQSIRVVNGVPEEVRTSESVFDLKVTFFSTMPPTPVIPSEARRKSLPCIADGRAVEGSRRCVVPPCRVKAFSREFPDASVARSASSGSFDSPSLSRYAGSFGLAQDDRWRMNGSVVSLVKLQTTVPTLLRFFLVILLTMCTVLAFAADGGAVRGVVTDPLGAVVSGAAVELLQGNRQVAAAIADGQGNFQLAAPSSGHYRVRASAPGFAPTP